MREPVPGISVLCVKDYMTPNPSTLTLEHRLLDAHLLMRSGHIRHLPVVSDGRLVGLLSERDLHRYAPSVLHSRPEEYNEIFENTLVGTVMTREVNTISPEAPLAVAIELIRSHRLGCLPVMEGERLVGILTRDDIVRSLRESEERHRNLVQGLDAIVWEGDAVTWQFTFVSQRAEAMLGYPVDQWLKEPDFWVNHLHPDDREQAITSCREAIGGRKGQRL